MFAMTDYLLNRMFRLDDTTFAILLAKITPPTGTD